MTDWLSSSCLSVVLLILTNTVPLRSKYFIGKVAFLVNKYKALDLFGRNINNICNNNYYVAPCD